ncbi:MAG TPA: DUF4019 domain-containing protein [Gemmatimonadales bacterium]|nr:DUF4019 domain-containing protein [Gemmatimonadales bacterium]
MRRTGLWSLVLLLVLVVSPRSLRAQATTDTLATIQAATDAAVRWLALLDDGRNAESWDSAATGFQAAVTQPNWVQSVLNARLAFEPFGERQRIAAKYTTQIPNAPPGEYVLLQYRTRVSGERTVIETVVPMRDGARGWRVGGYFVRPE